MASGWAPCSYSATGEGLLRLEKSLWKIGLLAINLSPQKGIFKSYFQLNFFSLNYLFFFKGLDSFG